MNARSNILKGSGTTVHSSWSFYWTQGLGSLTWRLPAVVVGAILLIQALV